MISLRQLPLEINPQLLKPLWSEYKMHGDLKVRDRIFEGLMRKVYVWCWPYTHKYLYGDDALAAAYTKLADCIERCVDYPYLRAHTVGTCLNYIRENQPSMKRSWNVTERCVDDVTKVEWQSTSPVLGYDVQDLIHDLRLSRREANILDQYMKGHSAGEIGLALGITDRHVRRIMQEIKTLIARKYHHRRAYGHTDTKILL